MNNHTEEYIDRLMKYRASHYDEMMACRQIVKWSPFRVVWISERVQCSMKAMNKYNAVEDMIKEYDERKDV